jgi:hypothetical protein
MATMTKIENDLAALLDIKRKKSEKDQAWFKRLVMGAEEVDEDEWMALPEETQEWRNAGAEALEKGDEIPAPEDSPNESENDTESEDEDAEVDDESEEEDNGDAEEDTEDESEDEDMRGHEDEEETMSTKSRKAPAKKAPAKKAAAKGKAAKPIKEKAAKGNGKTPEKKARGGKPQGAQAFIRGLIIENPKVTTDELLDAIKKKGFQPMTRFTISTTRSSTMQTLRVAKDLGKLRGVAV